MKQRAFPFQIPDSALLDILEEIKKIHLQAASIQEWFYSVMLLLDSEGEVHFGDLVVAFPHDQDNGNGPSRNLSIFSYLKGDVRQSSEFPNAFLAQAYRHCSEKKAPVLTEIQWEEKKAISCPLPYCPAVIPLGCRGTHFGLFAAGSYHDRAIVMRNRRFFGLLGIEMSQYLMVRHMERIVSRFLFDNEPDKKVDTLRFEDLLTLKFRQLMDRIDSGCGGNILGEVVALVERVLIQLALEKTGHKLGHSASLLGISRNTLRKKIQMFGIDTVE